MLLALFNCPKLLIIVIVVKVTLKAAVFLSSSVYWINLLLDLEVDLLLGAAGDH